MYSLCYAAQRVEAAELLVVREQLLAKYGKYINIQAITHNENNTSPALDRVNGRVRPRPPPSVPRPRLPANLRPRSRDVSGCQLLEKLKVRPPDPRLVNEYLRAIATSFNVVYTGGESEELPVRCAAVTWLPASTPHACNTSGVGARAPS